MSELVHEVIHLGAAICPELPDGCQNSKNGKSWKSHGGGTRHPEHHDESDPERPDQSNVKIWK